jgi:hypothetical protein
MTFKNQGYSPIPVIKGHTVHAIYRETGIFDYKNNPLIEALPSIITADEAVSRLAHYPRYDETLRQAPDHIRYHLIQNGMRFFAPLDIHVDLERRFSCLIRVGYASRNPLTVAFWKNLDGKFAKLDQYWDQYDLTQRQLTSATPGFNIIGLSGIGKSASVLRVLSLYPQIIHHNRYREQNFTYSQIVWLKLDCPFDGSIKGLCNGFFQTIDDLLRTNYRKDYGRRASIDELLINMATVAATHCLGVLVIDEIQRLSMAKSGGAERMLNFFVELVNRIGVPVVLMGNYKALPILSGDFSQMRRGTGQGDLIWDRMVKDDQWQLFIESLWRFQYTRKKSTLEMDPSLCEALYDETQGITDFAIKIYMLAQERAIDSKKEIVTAATLRSVSKDKLRMPRAVIRALKTGDKRVLRQYEDLYPSAFEDMNQLADNTVIKGKLASTVSTYKTYASEIAATNQTSSSNHVEVAPEIASGKINSETSSPSSNKSRAKSKVRYKEGLPGLIGKLDVSKNVTAYDVLMEAGYIRPASEFSG